MALNLQELKEWPPEIADLAKSARDAAANHTNSADFYRSLTTVSTWQGRGAEAARDAMAATAGEHDAVAEDLTKAAAGMERVHQDAEQLAEAIKRILDDAAAEPAVGINESTNQVIPPDTSYMTEEYAAHVAAKVSDLQARIAAALSDGERIDTELAGAITTASGTAEPAVRTALQDLLLPETGGQRDTAKSGAPDSLDSALDELTGQPDHGPGAPKPDAAAGKPAAEPVPLDPKAVEAFKNNAREVLLQNGVPPEQVEQRLDAMVAAAQRPQPTNTPPKPESMPEPSFGEGFADGWFGTEENIKDLIGANGMEDLKDSWTDLAKGTWERITNPIDSWKEQAEHATKYPGHYLGEIAGGTALTAPSALFGGEAALAARAGAGIPDDLIDMPSPTGTIDHPAPTPLVDIPNHHGTQAPQFDAPPPPLPPDSPLFDGWDPIPPGPEFINADGGLIYPDDSLPTKPYAVPGTIIDNAEVPQGTIIDRFGYPGGAYLSPEGVPFAERALPPDSAAKPYYQYVVEDTSKLPPGWRIEQSQAAPWFNQPGGGTQYRIIAPEGVTPDVQTLIDWGYLREIR